MTSAYGFRAPTLNELYRQFSVGPVMTRANDQLGPERLVGGEAGHQRRAGAQRDVRTTWYDNRVKDPVANVTIGTNLQQRQNLGKTRIWGIQSDVEYRLGSFWRFSGGYLYNQAKVKENPTRTRRSSETPCRKFPHTAARQVRRMRIQGISTVAAGVQFHRAAVRRRSECADSAGGCAGRGGLQRRPRSPGYRSTPWSI